MELTKTELTRLGQCEAVIAEGAKTFVAVGNALLEIRDKRLYRLEFSTFEDYCFKKWGIARRHSYRMIAAAEIVENVSHGTHLAPQNERQLRPLTILEPEEQREVWAQVVEQHGEAITAEKVQIAVNDHQQRKEPEFFELPKAHVSNNSGDNEWYTPKEIVDAARSVLGTIDLDPASSEAANEQIKALRFFSEEDNGLLQNWSGKVWMNPPYSQPLIQQFCEKLYDSLEAGLVTEAVVLVNNATETRWFQDLAQICDGVCFPKARIRFWAPSKPSNSPLQGQAILYFGDNFHSFQMTFLEFGLIFEHGHF